MTPTAPFAASGVAGASAGWWRHDAVATGVLFAVAYAIFWASPVQHRTDSRYTLLVTETLLRTGRLNLDPQAVAPPGEGAGYNLERTGERVHFRPPPGSAVFSVPFVLALRPFGLSVLDAHGRYDPEAEYRAQRIIASLLMAGFAVFVYRTARLLLPTGASVLVAALSSLGTQVWSTASRALWSDTWSVALMGYVVWRLAALELAGRRIHPALLATLLAAVFFARPTGAAHALVVSVHVAWWHRRMLPGLIATGLGWLAVFLGFSWAVYGRPLPGYYSLAALGTSAGWQPLAANLLSPSRGLLVCVPVVPAVLVLLWKHRRTLDTPARRLATAAAAGIAGQLLVVAFWYVWWSGHSYGARHTTGTVPWVALLIAITGRALREAALADGRRGRRRAIELSVAALVAAFSVWIQARGALTEATQRWNLRPADVDDHPERVWNWRYPQWLAGVIPAPAGPARPLPLGRPLMVGDVTAEVYLREGWSWPEPERRWIDEDSASAEFVLDADGLLVLRARLERPPWEATDRSVEVELNGRAIATWVLRSRAPAPFVALLDGARRGANRLTLRALGGYRPAPAAADERHLRLGVRWLRLDSHPTLPRGHTLSLGQDEADPFVGSGWGDPEGDYRWTVSPRADLYLAAEALPPGILRLKAHAYPVSTRGAGQRVFVSVDDALVHTFALTGSESAIKSVPLSAGIPRLGRVTLDLPDLVTEAPAGETRRLGAAVHWVRYDAFPVLRPGERVDLGSPSGAAFLGDGWAEPENGRRWTLGTSAEMYFATEPGRSERLILVLDAFLHRRLPAQRVRFELNGERLGELTIAEAGRRPVELTLPPNALQAHNVLRLLLPDARSPASIGVSRDARVLGVRVGGVELR